MKISTRVKRSSSLRELFVNYRHLNHPQEVMQIMAKEYFFGLFLKYMIPVFMTLSIIVALTVGSAPKYINSNGNAVVYAQLTAQEAEFYSNHSRLESYALYLEEKGE